MSAKKSFNGAVCFEAALTGLTLLFLMVPVIQMVITAFTVNAFRGIKSGLTTQWLVKVLELYGDTIVRSLGLALMTLIVCVIVGVPAAWVLVREQRKRWAAFVEEAFILPLSMPGLAVGHSAHLGRIFLFPAEHLLSSGRSRHVLSALHGSFGYCRAARRAAFAV